MSHEDHPQPQGDSDKAEMKPRPKVVGDKSITRLTWAELQGRLLDEGVLPDPIPPTHTARRFSGLPPDRTPALDMGPRVESVLSLMLAFWNESRGDHDQDMGLPGTEPHAFIPTPLDVKEIGNPKVSHNRRYLTFAPDTGGWKNLRMSLEDIVHLTAISGRMLVLPPDQFNPIAYWTLEDTFDYIAKYCCLVNCALF